ncbi:transporter [cyanobacterium TDX16]|nr:transporter [cyanobacterium TDX16]
MQLLILYAQLIGLVLLGFFASSKIPQLSPHTLGQFLFWIGVPISIIAFLRQADLSGAIWIAPICAWIAILLGAGLAWGWIQLCGSREEPVACGGSPRCANWRSGVGSRGKRAEEQRGRGAEERQQSTVNQLPTTNYPLSTTHYPLPTQGSFLLAAMVGNTGYIGFPVALAVVGTQYFGWTLFYDLLGSTLGSYGLGVVLAARFGKGKSDRTSLIQAILVNPALWSMGFGLLFRQVALPAVAESILSSLGWSIVALSLILIGMRLQHLNSWRNLPKAAVSLTIKMLIVPLVVGSVLTLCGFTGAPQLAIVLQMAMPPAFATLVIAEAYDLDRDLAVTALALGSASLLLTLPLWLWLFGVR